MKRVSLFLFITIVCIGFCYSQNIKSVSILGDSYSTFDGYVQPDTNYVWYYTVPKYATDVTSVTQTWWHKFIEENGYELCVNNSFSGSTICNTGYRKEDYSDRSFITRMNNLGDPNIIFIFGGTNDAWAGVPLGDYKYRNWNHRDLYEFRPAMAIMLSALSESHPDSEIYFILNSDLKEEINESVRTICKYYKIDCIVLHNIDKKQNHPSVKGMEQIYRQVKNYIDRTASLQTKNN